MEETSVKSVDNEKKQEEVIVYICPSQLRGQVIESMDKEE